MLQGGLDGGIDIPHSEKRFIGYDTEGKKLDAETLQRYIYGGNVSDYMEWLQEENGDKYHTHFKKALAEDLDAEAIEDMYKEVGDLFIDVTPFLTQVGRTICLQTCLPLRDGRHMGGQLRR